MRLFPFSICWLFSHKEARNKHCLLQHSASSFSSHLIYWRMEIISGPDTYCSTQYNPENSFFLQIRLSTSCWTFSVIEFLTTNFVKLSEQNIYLSIKISISDRSRPDGLGGRGGDQSGRPEGEARSPHRLGQRQPHWQPPSLLPTPQALLEGV